MLADLWYEAHAYQIEVGSKNSYCKICDTLLTSCLRNLRQIAQLSQFKQVKQTSV